MTILRLLNGSLCELEEVAGSLAQSRRNMDLELFGKTSHGIGMDSAETLMFWNSINTRYGIGFQFPRAKENVQFSAKHGILLRADILPQNLLLYRIIELLFPSLFRMRVSKARHRGEVKIGQWSFLDNQHKQILHFKFYPSKPRTVGAWYLD